MNYFIEYNATRFKKYLSLLINGNGLRTVLFFDQVELTKMQRELLEQNVYESFDSRLVTMYTFGL